MTKEEIKQYSREYYQRNKERIKERTREYSKNNDVKVKETKRAYYEANKQDISIKSKKYYQEHSEEIKQRAAEYYEKNKDKVLQYASETQMGRANNLLSAYNQQDEMHGRGRGDLTAKWIVTNILSQPCVHCGEPDWTKIGCNRLDNSKPHTMDNVEPCCRKCNIQMGADDRKKTVLQYTLDGELVKEWECISDAVKSGFTHVLDCCNGVRSQCKNYIWRFKDK